MNYNNMNCRSNAPRCDKTPCNNTPYNHAPCSNTPCSNSPCNNSPYNNPCRDNTPHDNSCHDNMPHNNSCRDNTPHNHACRDNIAHADSPCAMPQHDHMQQGYAPHKCSPLHECMEIPTGNRKRLLCFINEVSFAVDDSLLYLDTHPDCEEALCYFHKYNQLRNRALAEYEKEYGPLVIASADDSCRRSWEWMSQPWPWEGGMC